MTLTFPKIALAASLALAALTLGVSGASAMPAVDQGVALAAAGATNIDQAHWRRYHHYHRGYHHRYHHYHHRHW